MWFIIIAVVVTVIKVCVVCYYYCLLLLFKYCVCLFVRTYTVCLRGLMEANRWYGIPWNWSCRPLRATMWVLGGGLRPSVRAVCAHS